MKRNVDLTESRMFSNQNAINHIWINVNTGIQTHIGIASDEQFSSNSSFSDEYNLDHQRESIIATGNKTQRNKIKWYREMENPTHCVRCGNDLCNKPWISNGELCEQCETDLDKEHSKLWRLDESIQNAVIRIA